MSREERKNYTRRVSSYIHYCRGSHVGVKRPVAEEEEEESKVKTACWRDENARTTSGRVDVGNLARGWQAAFRSISAGTRSLPETLYIAVYASGARIFS